MAVTTAAVIGAGAAVKGAYDSNKNQKAAVSAQKDQLASNEAFIKEQAAKARADTLPLFDAAQQNRMLGGQAALDIFGAAVPQQASLFQQGNVGAQQMLGQGAQQFQNAILGMPVDYSYMQPQQFETDFSFMPTELPNFTTSQQALNPAQPQNPQPNVGIGNMPILGGGGFGPTGPWGGHSRLFNRGDR